MSFAGTSVFTDKKIKEIAPTGTQLIFKVLKYFALLIVSVVVGVFLLHQIHPLVGLFLMIFLFGGAIGIGLFLLLYLLQTLWDAPSFNKIYNRIKRGEYSVDLYFPQKHLWNPSVFIADSSRKTFITIRGDFDFFKVKRFQRKGRSIIFHYDDAECPEFGVALSTTQLARYYYDELCKYWREQRMNAV